MRLLVPLLLLATPLAAQQAPAPDPQALSAEELGAVFAAQREAMTHLGETRSLGESRGFEEYTVEDLATSPVLVAAPVAEDVVVAATQAPDALEVPDAPDLGLPGSDEVAAGGTDGAVAGGTVSVALADPVPDSAPGLDATPATPITYVRFDPARTIDVHISFNLDSASIRSDQVPALQTLCEAMEASGDGVFRIYGHTDASGSDAYNERLSLLRAEEVRRWFTGTCGLPEARLEAVGLGERFPVDGSAPDDPGNRRVEFQAVS